MAISTANRPFRIIIGELPADRFLLTGFKGREAMSDLFHFHLDLEVESEEGLDFAQVLGKPALLEFENGGPTRKIFGIISKLSQVRKQARFIHYKAELVPPLWILTHEFNSGIFQNMTIKEILNYLLALIGGMQELTFEFQQEYTPRNFCCQYRETSFNFISRLMEGESIYYFYDHSGKKPELVIADLLTFRDLPSGKKIRFDENGSKQSELVTEWTKSQSLQTTNVTYTDRHFQKFGDNYLIKEKASTDPIKAGKVEHDSTVGKDLGLSVFDAPGGYAHWHDDIDRNGGEREDIKHILEEGGFHAYHAASRGLSMSLTIEGVSSIAGLTPGFFFELENHFDADGDYLVIAVEHVGTLGSAQSNSVQHTYSNRFTCIPKSLQYYPEVRAKKPYIRGTQTAMVVGGDKLEIDPDKFGRVKVCFHWDKVGPKHLESSCWVRVAQFWAGKQWGAQFIPRIGDEVVVAFEEGDPDKPLIIGSVYNSENMPIYKLPDNKTQSGIKTHSSMDGTTANYNELKFEDKKGAEFVSIHAEKDMMTSVEDNSTISVGTTADSKGTDPKKTGTMTVTVYGDTKQTVTKGDFTETIKAGKHATTVKGDTSLIVESGNYSLNIQSGTSTVHVASDVTETYDTKQTTTVKGGDQLTQVPAGNHLVKCSGHASLHPDGNRYVNTKGFYDCIAADKITLTTGSSSIEMLSGGTITIRGVDIIIDGSSSVKVIGGGADTGWTGSKITENGPSGVAVTGATIKLNS